MKVIILAAGIGSRLKPFTDTIPKPLVNVADRPIIEYVLQSLRSIEFSELIVVCGHFHKQIIEYFENASQEVITLENPISHAGNITSLMTAREHISDDLLLLNADHIYPSRMVEKFIESCDLKVKDIEKGARVFIGCDFRRKLVNDDMKVQIGPERSLRKIGKDLVEFNGGYVGMTFIPAEFIGQYVDALEGTYEKMGEGAVVEDILSFLLNTGSRVECVILDSYRWYDIDTPDDLRNAEKSILLGELQKTVPPSTSL